MTGGGVGGWAAVVAALPVLLQPVARHMQQVTGAGEVADWLTLYAPGDVAAQALAVQELLVRSMLNPYGAGADVLLGLMNTDPDVVTKFRAEGDLSVEFDPGALAVKLALLERRARRTGGAGSRATRAASVRTGPTLAPAFLPSGIVPLGEYVHEGERDA